MFKGLRWRNTPPLIRIECWVVTPEMRPTHTRLLSDAETSSGTEPQYSPWLIRSAKARSLTSWPGLPAQTATTRWYRCELPFFELLALFFFSKSSLLCTKHLPAQRPLFILNRMSACDYN